MTEAALSQWVVRLPDRLVRLHRPLIAIRIFSTAEVMLFKTHYGAGESKARIERQQDANARQTDVPVEYWVLLFPLDTAIPLEVLCCTVQRETADRILESLWLSMFSNCGDNTYIDLRKLLVADLSTPEQAAVVPAAGRFVDLGDGESLRPAVTTESVATADIPVQTIPTATPSEPATSDALRNWVRRADSGADRGRWGSVGSSGLVRAAEFDTVNYAGIAVQPAIAAQSEDALPAPAPSPALVSRVELEEMMRHSTVPHIGRGTDRNDAVLSPRERDRIQVQLQAALMRQQAANRNTRAMVLPHNVDYSDYLQPQDIASPPAQPEDTLAARDARRRANPMFGLDD